MTLAKKHPGKKQIPIKITGRLKKFESEVDEIPRVDETFWDNAVIGSPLHKRLISLRLDNDVIDWFKSQGMNYQTRMNLVLRSYMEWHKQMQR
jgi:uncharacterized protein (DUF4415 family)